MPTPENHERVVYYMVRVGYNVVKIGTTVNIEKRLQKYKRGKKGIYEIVAMEFGDLEKQRHREFADAWLLGEWFFLTEELLDHIWSLPRIELRGEH